MKPSIYDFVNAETSALNEVMKCLIELNVHLLEAVERGWDIALRVDDDGVLAVDVTRGNWEYPSEAPE